MVSVLNKYAIDRGFEPRSGQTIDYKIGICCCSTKLLALKRWGEGENWLTPSEATCLPTDSYVRELEQ